MINEADYDTEKIYHILKEKFEDIIEEALSAHLYDLSLIAPPTIKHRDCLNFMFIPSAKALTSFEEKQEFCDAIDKILAENNCTVIVRGEERPLKCAVHSKNGLESPGWEIKKIAYEPVIRSAISLFDIRYSKEICPDLNVEWQKRANAVQQSQAEKIDKLDSPKAYASTNFLNGRQKAINRKKNSKLTANNGIGLSKPLSRLKISK